MNTLADIIAVALLGKAAVAAGDAHSALLTARLPTSAVRALYWDCKDSLADVAAAWGIEYLNPYTLVRCLGENVAD